MSSFGDNIKTRMQEALDEISYEWYGKNTYSMTSDEKLKFLGDVFEVLHYMFGEWY